MADETHICPVCGQNLDCEKWLIDAKDLIGRMVTACENASITIALLEAEKKALIQKLGLPGDCDSFVRTDGGLIIPQAKH